MKTTKVKPDDLKIRIRRLKPADYPAIKEMISAIPEFSKLDQTIAVELLDWSVSHPKKDEYVFLVAIDNSKQAVGFLCYGPTPLTVGTYDLYWIGVHPLLGRKRIGKRLITVMEKRVKGKGGRIIIIETSSDPIYQKACRFYIRQGYQLQEKIPDFYKPGEDRLTFLKKL
jgi:ribosomal protein S18 acetylase RimI-like enzyme